MNIDNLVDSIISKHNIKQKEIQDKKESLKKMRNVKWSNFKLALDHAIFHSDAMPPLLMNTGFIGIIFGISCIGSFSLFFRLIFFISMCILTGISVIVYIVNCIMEYKHHMAIALNEEIKVKTIHDEIISIRW
jgi:hypothetical protein